MPLGFLYKLAIAIPDTYFDKLGMAVNTDAVFFDILDIITIWNGIKIPDDRIRITDKVRKT